MGLFSRASKEPKFPPLVPIPAIADLPEAKLQAAARYLGTVEAGGERVIGQGLSAKSSARLNLSREALDVVRMAGSFRITVDALLGARAGERFDGKPVPGLLIVSWRHGDHEWETGFRMEALKSLKAGDATPRVDAWVRSISKLARENGSDKNGSDKNRSDKNRGTT